MDFDGGLEALWQREGYFLWPDGFSVSLLQRLPLTPPDPRLSVFGLIFPSPNFNSFKSFLLKMEAFSRIIFMVSLNSVYFQNMSTRDKATLLLWLLNDH